jgi:hypothetical protein
VPIDMSTQRLREATLGERFERLDLPPTARTGMWHWRDGGDTAFRDITDQDGTRYRYTLQFLPLGIDIIYEALEAQP